MLKTSDLVIGEPLPVALRKEMIIQLMRMRAWGGFNPIHWDEDFARQRGFPAPVATGTMTSAYIAQVCVECFGAPFFTDSVLAVKFARPVYAGDQLTVRGVLRDLRPDDGRSRATVDLWCERDDGTKVTVAEAECWVED